MALWCKIFMSVLMLVDFGSLSLVSCSIQCSWMAPLYSKSDYDEGVGFPSVILYNVD